MQNPAHYHPLNGQYDAFLFTEIGEQENSMPISVASALARQGLDPWDEAQRLAALPAVAAIAALTQMMGRLPCLAGRPSEIPKLSARLVGLLSAVRARPADGVALPASIGQFHLDPRWAIVVFLIGIAILASRFFMSK